MLFDGLTNPASGSPDGDTLPAALVVLLCLVNTGWGHELLVVLMSALLLYK